MSELETGDHILRWRVDLRQTRPACAAAGEMRSVSAPHCHPLLVARPLARAHGLVQGDITRQQVDAIVTAANESLLGGGGVDGAIHAAAGPRLADAGNELAPCDPGDAKATPAFDLQPQINWVIHTVGPVWEGGSYGEVETLASCYRRVLEVADDLGARTLAVPAIATGVYGYPPAAAADIAVHTLRRTRTAVDLVRIVAFDDENYAVLQDRLSSDGPSA